MYDEQKIGEFISLPFDVLLFNSVVNHIDNPI